MGRLDDDTVAVGQQRARCTLGGGRWRAAVGYPAAPDDLLLQGLCGAFRAPCSEARRLLTFVSQTPSGDRLVHLRSNFDVTHLDDVAVEVLDADGNRRAIKASTLASRIVPHEGMRMSTQPSSRCAASFDVALVPLIATHGS